MTNPAPPRGEDQVRPRLPTALVTWAFIGSILMLVAALVIVKLTEGTGPSATSSPHPLAPASVVAALARIPAAAFDRAASASVSMPPEVLSGQAPLTAGGVPEVVFVGADFSPYSAAESWALVAALDRFGSFVGLGSTASSDDEVFARTPGFSFVGADYHSSHLVLVAVDRYASMPSTLAPAGFPQQASLGPVVADLLRRYDSRSATDTALPFVDVGNRLTVAGADFGFSPGLLEGMSMAQVAADLGDATSPVAEEVLAAADELSAAICGSDGQEPPVVCASSGVRQAAAKLGIG